MTHKKTISSALKVSERDIQRTCSDLLALDGWRMLRTDPCSDRARGKGFGEIGMADCLYIRHHVPITWLVPLARDTMYRTIAQVMWIEWKTRGGKMSMPQKIWHSVERDRGALTLIAGQDFETSIEGFISWYRASGLNRGKV